MLLDSCGGCHISMLCVRGIVDFTQIHKDDVLIAGGKGANLGEMTAAGIPVPKGFVITADAYREFLKANKIDEIISRSLNDAQTDEQVLISAAGEFRKRIAAGHFPAELEKEIRAKYAELGETARVAVRSSATAEDLPDASFAGQQETYLNVRAWRMSCFTYVIAMRRYGESEQSAIGLVKVMIKALLRLPLLFKKWWKAKKQVFCLRLIR